MVIIVNFAQFAPDNSLNCKHKLFCIYILVLGCVLQVGKLLERCYVYHNREFMGMLQVIKPDKFVVFWMTLRAALEMYISRLPVHFFKINARELNAV